MFTSYIKKINCKNLELVSIYIYIKTTYFFKNKCCKKKYKKVKMNPPKLFFKED